MTYTEVRYEYTPQLAEILEALNVALLVSTYQAGKLLVLGVHNGKLDIAFCDLDQPMGLAVHPARLAVGTRRQVHFFAAAPETASSIQPAGKFDGCYVPRASCYTGNIHGHEIAWGSDELWVVNTLFSCLCTLHEDFSFVPRWRPPFISQLIGQDRCHLNGLAMEHGQPKYVTVLGETDEPAGWRDAKATGGGIVDVTSGQTIARGMSMPHSPRVAEGVLYVLNSGHGSISHVDVTTGRIENITRLPGYTRGLTIVKHYAFVGLSKIRETGVFGGLPISQSGEPLRCGVGVVDLRSGRTIAVFQFHTGVDEVFAVDVVPGVRCPCVASSSSGEHERDVWIVPAETMPRPAVVPRLPLFVAPGRHQPAHGNQPHAPPAIHHPSTVADATRLHRAGKLDEAASVLEQLLLRADNPANLLVNLGNVRQDQGNQEAALDCYRRALTHDARCMAARQNLGYLLFNRGEPELAAEQFEALLAQAPTAMNRLLAASVLPIIYQTSSDVQAWRDKQIEGLESMVAERLTVNAAVETVPTSFFWAYQGQNDRHPMQLRGRILQGAEDVPAKTVRASSRSTSIDGARPLRVGYLSAYFRDHTIGRLNIGCVERLNRDDFHVTVITPTRSADALSERFRRAADQFVLLTRDVAKARHEIARLSLDVLVFADVGMDALTSTLAFSRLAPVQCALWGHPDTTGSPYMDYFVSSTLLEIDDADAHYTESLARLPLLGVYYERPELPRRPGRQRGREAFGLPSDRHVYLCPQTLFKFHPEFDELLAAILRADPLGELVVLEGRVPEWTRRLQQRWATTLGENHRRVRFLSAQPRHDFLALLQLADVVLDPLHFGGGNSSYEAFAMGTPVVTLPSSYLRGRITRALYEKMGLSQLVATSAEQYVEMAVHWGSDPTARSAVRAQIEAASPVLFEDIAEVRAVEQFLRTAGS